MLTVAPWLSAGVDTSEQGCYLLTMTNANETKTAELKWNDTVTVERALSILGYGPNDLDALDASHAACRAAGAWDANERESYVAWRSIAAALKPEPRHWGHWPES